MMTTYIRSAVLLLLCWAATGTRTHVTHAQVPKVTAAEVVDRASLKGFVTWAASRLTAVQDINGTLALRTAMRTEGSDFNSGNMYLIIFTTSGQVLTHGENPLADSRNAIGIRDDDGNLVVQQLLTAGAQDGGGFVEWCWDDPASINDVYCKDSYALRYRAPLASDGYFVLVGGYYQDLTSAELVLPDVPFPEVSAADVVDRETLQQFVDGTLSWLQDFRQATGGFNAGLWRTVLREEGGHFKSGSVYIFIFTSEVWVVFHGASPWREGRIGTDTVDINGVPFVDLIVEKALAGGGFTEYFWDDPEVEGDEDTGSPKVAYARAFTGDFPGLRDQQFIIGSGFYRNFSTAEAEDAAEDWLSRFGRSVGSQVMEIVGNRATHPYGHVEIGGRALDLDAVRGGFAGSGENALPRLGSWLTRAGSALQTGPGVATVLPHATYAHLDGTSFAISPGGVQDGTTYSLWGGGEFERFTNETDDGFGNGDVATAALGGDLMIGTVLAGVAIAHSRGTGRFELGRPGQDDYGDVTTTLTGGFPYASLSVRDRLHTWGVIGYGTGQLDIEGSGDIDPQADISMLMSGLAMKAELVQSEDAHDLELAVRSDAFVTSLSSEEVEGLRALSASSSRIRLMLEGSAGLAMGSSTLRPQLRVAMRRDGGGSDTGFGLEVGGGLIFLNPSSGLTVRVHGRTLVAHADEGYSEWGAGGSINLSPGQDGHGLTLDVRPSWGSLAPSLERLWAGGAAAMVPGSYGFGVGQRGLDAEVGYGIRVLDSESLVTPYVRLELSEALDASWFGNAVVGQPVSVTAPAHRALGYQMGSRVRLGANVSAGVEVGRITGPFMWEGANLATVSLSVR